MAHHPGDLGHRNARRGEVNGRRMTQRMGVTSSRRGAHGRREACLDRPHRGAAALDLIEGLQKADDVDLRSHPRWWCS
jgi:hypothetical protein